jgi:hypothetical protein
LNSFQSLESADPLEALARCVDNARSPPRDDFTPIIALVSQNRTLYNGLNPVNLVVAHEITRARIRPILPSGPQVVAKERHHAHQFDPTSCRPALTA